MTYLPFGWERLWLSGALPDRVLCHARVRPVEEDGGDSDAGVVPEVRLADLSFYDLDGRPLGGVTGFSLKRAPRAALLSASERIEDLLYEVVWRERPLAGGPRPAAFLAGPEHLAEATPDMAALLSEEGLDPADLFRFADDSDRLSRAYALAALDELGFDRRAGSVVVAPDLRRRLKVVEDHERLFGHLLGLLAEGGVLAADDEAAEGRYRVLIGAGDRLPDPALGDPGALLASLQERYAFGRIELGLLSRCGAALAQVLRGRSDPLALLFSEEGASAAALYREAPAARAYNRLVAETVSAAVSGLPEGRRLRVLEVGAGTGGTTASVLPALPADRVDYVYTDISAGFFADAEARFGPELDYRVLDIERDPVAQGFAAYGYDLVVAANVLHATRDIGASLGHCRDLLSPSGVLVALEGLRRQGWLDLTFGLLEGWWRFADGYRSEHALLDGAGWRHVLLETGYEAASVLGADEAGASQGVIVARGPSQVRERPGVWLLAADAGGAASALAEGLAAGLAERDQTVVLAGAGLENATADVTGQDIPEADATETEIPVPAGGRVTRAYVEGPRRETWVSLLEGLPDEVALRGVVHLSALDGPDGAATVSELSAATARCGSSALALSQALLDRGAAPEGGLWLVTRGAQVVDREPAACLSGTPLWGLGKTLALEAAQLQPRMIDLDPAADPQTTRKELIEPLIEELLYPDAESHVAHRAAGRLAARLVRGVTAERADDVPAPLIRPDRSYLVTGGLGGIGLRVADWLADRGAGRIVLNGRRPPDGAAEAAIAALEARGASVDVRLADVTDADAVDGMLTGIAALPLPLGGVVHSVGVLSDAAVSNQSWERFETVLAPKLLGAWQLHRATLDLNLDLFVLFSSMSGVLGNAGQANHAAANAFLDQLARHRRSLGLAGQAMAWGAWSGLGEAEEQRERIAAGLAASGVGWIAPEQGLRAFDRLVRQDVAAGVVVPVEWSVFGSRLAGRPALLEELLADEAMVVAEAEAGHGAALPAAERPGQLVALVTDELRSVLRLGTAPAPSAGFFDLGMDSLMAIELTRRLERALEVKLEASALFDHPTVDKLARHLGQKLGALDEDATVRPPAQAALRRRDDEPIAIVGLACRLPEAPDAASFWDLLVAGRDTAREVPRERWDIEAWYDSDPEAPGKMYVREASFLSGIDRFDAGFFGISPREAIYMDPQQRLLLETAWAALEDAGLPAAGLSDSRTGVFTGSMWNEYAQWGLSSVRDMDAYMGTGSGGSFLAGRLAFQLGLQGPAMPVDTACSSSLVAIHLACQALRRDECEVALAAGVNLMLLPEASIMSCRLRALSPDGRCKAFDARADGFGRGEGVGVVVLKRLSEAERDGDRIHAVIRGSAVNHNGPSAGLTVPNGEAQRQVIAAALSEARVTPEAVGYLEAHGTGTSLGDPIELRAALAVYGQGRDPEHPLLVGSVKTNIGHLE
ncbi:SDR family NAD(P)-dependent oxidoreductase, partial [Yoonia sp. R2-816]|uniref:SDR family NAD(P)-dependent oxidoreductase n=1 Tax=Yoonia sp. R2-816 TaxID=3342638 RepID=UPI00372AFA58